MMTKINQTSRYQEDSRFLVQPSQKLYLTELELATRWNISVKTLQRWRGMGKKPVFSKFGRTVRYPLHGVGGVLDMEASIALTQSGEHGHE
jgi:hypothetical protein